jgi:hypothetical protein
MNIVALLILLLAEEMKITKVTFSVMMWVPRFTKTRQLFQI